MTCCQASGFEGSCSEEELTRIFPVVTLLTQPVMMMIMTG
jgi:hypothetical protein